MDDLTPHTTQLHGWLARHRAGSLCAADEMIRAIGGRLERLARKMLRGFPGVRRHADTNDVVQNAALRLLRAVKEVQPASMRDFYNLCAGLIRRELIDLARHFGQANRHEARATVAEDSPVPEPADRRDDRADVERWSRFHEGVERLPTTEREVVGLVFYHGWSQAQVAELLGVSVRSVQRYWQAALVRLHDEGAKG